MIGGNPAYNGPADLALGSKLGSVATTIHLSDYVDETSSLCTWHVNRAHYLEAWGDARAEDGTISVGQPLRLVRAVLCKGGRISHSLGNVRHNCRDIAARTAQKGHLDDTIRLRFAGFVHVGLTLS